MTAQSRDKITIDGKPWFLSQNPLDPLISGGNVLVTFVPVKSSNWRGYIAEWDIFENKLWLVKLTGNIKKQDGDKFITRPTELEEVMGRKGPIFAEWFTGELLCSSGKLINYVHAGYASQYEKQMILQVGQGYLRS